METSISEKTLELNICEEIITNIRRQHPKAYWYGPTLREEKHLGYDASVQGVKGYALFLQFKRPLRYSGKTPKEYPYWFEVNSEQHKTLVDTALDYPGSVQYALPLVGNKNELEEAVPNLRGDTNFYIIKSSDRLESPPKTHKVEVYPDKVIFHSDRLERNGYYGRNFGRQLSRLKTTLCSMAYFEFKELYRRLLLAYLRPYADKGTLIVEDGELLLDYSIPRAVFLPLEKK